MSQGLRAGARAPRGRWGLSASAGLLFSLSGCLVDEGRCGPHQESNAVGSCVCRIGYVPDDSLVCRQCGENEVSAGNICVCATGFSRTADKRCAALSEGLGQPCEHNEDCLSSAPQCETSASGEHYCTTTGCGDDTACPGGYGCDKAQSPSVCVRPPTGLGDACTTQQDCAGKEASYCETTTSKVCLVSNCKADADCFSGWECCDLTVYGYPSLCVPEGTCPFG